MSHIGVFLNGTFFLRNTFTTGPADTQFLYGPAGALPLAGKWVVGSAPSGVIVSGNGGGSSGSAPSATPAARQPGGKFD